MLQSSIADVLVSDDMIAMPFQLSLSVNYPTRFWDPVLLCLHWRLAHRSSYHWGKYFLDCLHYRGLVGKRSNHLFYWTISTNFEAILSSTKNICSPSILSAHLTKPSHFLQTVLHFCCLGILCYCLPHDTLPQEIIVSTTPLPLSR